MIIGIISSIKNYIEAKTAYKNARTIDREMGLDKDVEKCARAIQDLANNGTKLA